MTPPFPNSPSPAWYRQAEWKETFSKRNGVHYVGDEVIIDLSFVTAAYDTFKRTASFENGTNGVTLAATQRGYYSQFSTVTGSPAYSNTHAANGTLSLKIPAGTDQLFDWVYPTAVTTEEFGRLYLYATANPGALPRVTTSGANWSICVSATGKPTLVDAATNQFPLTNSIALNQWIRMEWRADYALDDLELKLFNTASSSTPTETLTETTANLGASSTSMRFGNQSGGDWGTDYWLDDIVTRADSYPGPFDPDPPIASAVTYTVRDFYGTVVSTGTFDEYQSWFSPEAPVGGWDPGWYRIYLTGSQSDANFSDSYGATNFCVIRSDSHFTAMPVGTTSPGDDPGNDYVMKGVMGMGTSRMNITNADAPTTGAQTLAKAVNDAAITADYWTDNGLPDTARPDRLAWLAFPNATWDALIAAQQGGGEWGYFYCADATLDGSQVFVQISAGTAANTDKVQVFFPNAVTLIETFDNLDNAAEAVTVINAGSTKIRFFARGVGRGDAVGPTAIGNDFHDGIVSVVSTLFPLGVTRFEGPTNEPTLSAETAHQMMLFQGAVHDGDASALAIGPCTVNISDLGQWPAFLDAGGGGFCDEISFHAYNAVTNGDMNLGKYTIDTFLALLASYGLQNKVLWQTESVNGFTPVYRIYHPRRARKPMLETLLFEQKGVPRERNNQWYDTSQGFWDVPTWIENADGSLEPQAVMGRVLAEETWGKPFSSALDFGVPGNSIFLGNVYVGSAGVTVALMATSFIEGASVTLTLGGVGSAVTTVDAWGNTQSVPVEEARVEISLTDVPMYVRLPVGATVAVRSVNDWPATGIGSSSSPSAITKEIDGVSYPVIANDAYMTNYASGTGIAPVTFAEPGDPVDILWDTPQTVRRILIWCGPTWQSSGTLIEFTVETTTDGINWTPQTTVTKSTPSYFEFGTDGSNVGCFLETYWDEQWIFDVLLEGSISATGVRLNVAESSYGGEPLSDTTFGAAFGQGTAIQAFRIEEVGVFSIGEDVNRGGGGGPAPPKGLRKRKAGDGEIVYQSYIILSG